jgi:hypothetical protein
MTVTLGDYARQQYPGHATDLFERSSTQARVPGDDIGVVAALVDDEDAANTLAGDLAGAGMFDVRIVSADGAWHSPA